MKNKLRPNEKHSTGFVDAARALECDESEERFDAALKKVAAHKPIKATDEGKENPQGETSGTKTYPPD
jgi:hypothetical protein